MSNRFTEAKSTERSMLDIFQEFAEMTDPRQIGVLAKTPDALNADAARIVNQCNAFLDLYQKLLRRVQSNWDQPQRDFFAAEDAKLDADTEQQWVTKAAEDLSYLRGTSIRLEHKDAVSNLRTIYYRTQHLIRLLSIPGIRALPGIDQLRSACVSEVYPHGQRSSTAKHIWN